MKDNEGSVYSIVFDVPKGCNPSLFFEDIKEFLSALEEFNHSLISGVDDTISVVSVIEDIELGSLRVKLKEFLESDKAKKIVGIVVDVDVSKNGIEHGIALLLFLELGREGLISLLSDVDIKSKEESERKQDELINKLKKKIPPITSGRFIPFVDEKKIKHSISRLAISAKKTQPRYQEENKEEIKLNGTIGDFVIENIEANGVNIISQINECTLYIDKPALHGKKWECIMGGKIKVTIKDEGFLKKIEDGYRIGTKTSMRVRLEIINHKNEKGEILTKNVIYNVLEVLKITEPVESGKFDFEK